MTLSSLSKGTASTGVGDSWYSGVSGTSIPGSYDGSGVGVAGSGVGAIGKGVGAGMGVGSVGVSSSISKASPSEGG